jgi:hypothetical protein
MDGTVSVQLNMGVPVFVNLYFRQKRGMGYYYKKSTLETINSGLKIFGSGV